ncbi:MAG: phosphoribosylformylglycinamidine cyclo-ligase, partial [Thermoprotei archaeon]
GYSGDIGGVRLEEELLRPMAIYSPMLIEALESGAVTGAAHITGGAFSKVKRILPPNSDAVMEVPEPPRIFRVLMELGRVPVDEMYRVFNMGIGLVLTAPSDRVDEVLRIASRHGHRAFLLGRVVEGRGRVVLKTPWGVDVEL